jgi:protein ImuB
MTAGLPQRVLVLTCPDWEQVAGPDAAAFDQVVTAVEDLCPRVEVLRPGACAIAARGPARYFGGEEALAARIAAAVAACGFTCQVGIADSLFAARLAARAAAEQAAAGVAGPHAAAGKAEPQAATGAAGERVATGAAGEQAAAGERAPAQAAAERVMIVAPGETPAFLARHPVSVLEDPELADLLARLGIRTLGEFAALPFAAAASRFGAQGAAAHRLARGLEPRPLLTRPQGADLSVCAEFDPPASLAEPVVFAAKALAEQMHAGLAASGLACVRVEAQVTCSDGREITRLWRHDGLLTALAVAERVRWQLAAWQTSQEPQEPRAPASGDSCQQIRLKRLPENRSHPGERGRGEKGPGEGRPGERRRGEVARGEVAQGERGRDEGEGAWDEGTEPGGITLLRLVPDQLVRATGRQLGLWGDAVVSDRVARAALRVQAMLGHDSVTRPVLGGGRGPADQVTLVPFGDALQPRFPADRPWPGRLPAPAPATVYPFPLPARVADAAGAAVTVTGRAGVSAPPARLSACGGPWLVITSWAGPWPVTERWWHPVSARRKARFQLVAENGTAWLAFLQDSRWFLEANYE